WDVDGNRYIDFTTGIAVLATGHAHPKVVKAVQDQAAKYLHMSGTDFYEPLQVRLAEKLNEHAPFSEPARVYFCNSGTEAVEAAIKLAQYHTGRQQFIGFLGGFHGRTKGSLAFTSSKAVQRGSYFPLMPGVTHVPYPDPYTPILDMSGYDDYGERVVAYIEETIFSRLIQPHEVAGILVEPILGEGGYVVPPDSFLPALRALCDNYGIMLIADEVQSGMGRTGKWWAIEHWGVEPDIVCSAKGIASGMPLGAVMAKQSVMTWGRGAQGSTYGGNPVACAAALATVELLEEGLVENAAEMGDYFLRRLRDEVMPCHPRIGEVRGKGLMIGMQLVESRESRQPAVTLRNSLLQYAFQEGLLLLGCGVGAMRFMPPLTVTRQIADEALEMFDRAFSKAEVEHPA
ncbi:MAG: acetyl ornithine aminotransferase family protein, partial [Anaerolineae bacterium]|nr:acetyl ornithine aminotransferase family protein [Anaerolineae bacterium]